MEKPLEVIDVCIVCALEEEVRALLEVLRSTYVCAIEERTSPRHQYPYRFTTIKNEKDELLSLHITWPEQFGPEPMIQCLNDILAEYQPRLAIMTGICAGDAQHVQLGDLVVAQRTFAYDTGKYRLDDQSRTVHKHDVTTYQLDANIRKFLMLFDKWEPLVAALPHPSPANSGVCRHIEPMASSNAVHADNPFPDVQVPLRGAIALDMESEAFSRTMTRHFLPWLVVKGVCDYADQNKSDVYHGYAAQASAVYALSFIQAYVTSEHLPRRDDPSPSSRAEPPDICNIPFGRNPFFTGREEILSSLCAQFQKGQAVALSGLGGIGKTQLALEYAYRQRENYERVFWVHAGTFDTLTSGYMEIARWLKLPPQESSRVVEQVKGWLKKHTHWLLILDNADDLALVREFLLVPIGGHLLLTTRAHSTRGLAYHLGVDTMAQEVGALFLLRRAGWIEQNAVLETASPEAVTLAKKISEELDGLPLALDQAGAYIDETSCGLAEYLDLFCTRGSELLSRRGGLRDDHPDPVATTWSLSFQEVGQQNPAAAEFLRFCAYLAPDVIPEEIITKGASYLGEILAPVAGDPFLLNQALEIVHAYSLMRRDPQSRLLTMHRLVQTVLREDTPQIQAQEWMQRAILAVTSVLSTGKSVDYERCLPHALCCVSWMDHKAIPSLEDLPLLNLLSSHLCNWPYAGDRGLEQARPVCQRAVAICEQHFGLTDPKTIVRLNMLAAANEWPDEGLLEEARSLYQRTLSLSEEHLNPTDPATIDTLCHVARFGYRTHMFLELGKEREETRILVNRAIALAKISYKHLRNATHSRAPTQLVTLSYSFFYKLDMYYHAEIAGRKALEMYEQQFDTADPMEMANCLRCLACVYMALMEYEEAEELYQQALSVSEKRLGATYPATLLTTRDLIDNYFRQWKYMEADTLCQRILTILEQLPEPTSHDVLSTAYYCSGKKYEIQEESLLLYTQADQQKQQGRFLKQLKKARQSARKQVLKDLE